MALPATFRTIDAVEEAFERIGFDPSTLVARHMVSAQRSIRLMLEEWANDQVHFYKVSQQTRTLTDGDTSFTTVAGTIDVLYAMVTRNSVDIELGILSLEEWRSIPNHATAEGMPNRYWIDRTTEPPVFRFYPKAENSTDVIKYDALMYFDDSTPLASAPNIRALWNEAFTAGLTAKLAEKFAPDRLEEKMLLAGGPHRRGGAYAIAKSGGNRERADLQIVPAKSRRFWR